jgi:hypothetical protein
MNKERTPKKVMNTKLMSKKDRSAGSNRLGMMTYKGKKNMGRNVLMEKELWEDIPTKSGNVLGR